MVSAVVRNAADSFVGIGDQHEKSFFASSFTDSYLVSRKESIG
jgi:hypothetical protein